LTGGHDDASVMQGSSHDPTKHRSGTPPKVGQSLSVMQAVATHTSNAGTHVASSGQVSFDAHSGVQNPFPFASVAQCWPVPSALGEQS
jgi:hypothetical protein